MRKFTMADVLNQSWGGPDFPSYEGRLDGEVMDSSERADAALAAFTGDDPQPDPAPNADPTARAAEPAADPNADPGADPNAPAQLTDEQLQGDPRFQELSTFKDSVVNALSEFPGLVDDKGQVNVKEAGLQLKDASILYDIMQGKGTPSALLDVMAQNAGWSDGQKQLVANNLIEWLTKGGYLKDGKAPAVKPGDPNFKDPLTDRIAKLEDDRRTETQKAEAARVQQHQETVFRTKFLPTVEKLCQQKGVPKEDFPEYANAVAAKIQGNKAILKRIEAGNYVDIQKFFSEIFNAETKRMQRWTKAQTAAADKKSKNPKIPAGGAPPAPASSAKTVDVRDRDSRIAAASELL
jgi:hypothetical protein